MRWGTPLIAAVVMMAGAGPAVAQYEAAAAQDAVAAHGRGADQDGNPAYLAATAPLVAPYFAEGDERILHDPFRLDWGTTRGEVLATSIVNRYGARLHARLYRPRGAQGRLPVVVFIPGFGFQAAQTGRGFSYDPMIQQIAEAGYVVLFFEPQGQGSSELDPSPREQFCGEHADAWWRQPQELGLRETSGCAGHDHPDIAKPGTPYGDAAYDAVGPELGGALGPVALVELQLQARRNEFDVEALAAGYGLFRNRFVFGTLDALDWLASAENPWRDSIDPSRTALVGHSAGADAATLAGNGDPRRRVDAVVALDGYGKAPATMPARVPTLLQQSEQQNIAGPWIPRPDPELWLNYETAARFREAGTPTGVVALRGSTHAEWSYVPFALTNPVAPFGNASSLGGQVGTYYTVAWLDRFLKEGAGQRADAERRLFAPTFDGSTDASSIGSGTYDAATRSNRPYRIAGRSRSEHLSRIFRSSMSLGGRTCLDLQAACP